MQENNMRTYAILGVMTLLIVSASLTFGKDKLKWEELVAKHLDSIGTLEARSSVKTRTMNGVARVIFRQGNTGQLSGKGRVISSERMTRIAMNFGHPDSGEHHAFDGKDVTVGFVKPGMRSNLSQFLHEHDFLLKEGLIGGVTSTSWCLYEVKDRRPKLNYRGLKKIEGTELHELEYKARKGAGSVRVSLYFQQETFRHVMSKYVLRIPAMMGRSPEESAQMRDSYFRVTEEYDNFQEVDGLTLPHSYKLIFSFEGDGPTFLTEYSIEASETVHNISVDRQTFRVQ